MRAGVAQLVEQRIRNAQVKGSSPFTSLQKLRRFGGASFHFTAEILPPDPFYGKRNRKIPKNMKKDLKNQRKSAII